MDRETRAWDRQDVEALLDLFHGDGRPTKRYALVDHGWKMTAQWGALQFDETGEPVTRRGLDE